MTTVVNRTARFGWVVYGAEILPFASAHFWTGDGGTGRCIGEKGDNQIVGLHCKEAAKLVKP